MALQCVKIIFITNIITLQFIAFDRGIFIFLNQERNLCQMKVWNRNKQCWTEY